MPVTVLSPYSGEGFEKILTVLAQKSETIEKGVVALHTGFNTDLYFPKLSLVDDDIVTDYSPTGVDVGSVGTYDYDEEDAVISLRALNVKMKDINPNQFRAVFTAMQLKPADLYLWPSLPPAVQTAFVLVLMQSVGATIEGNIWQGSRASGTPSASAKFKGLLTYLDEKGTFNDVTPTGATDFTEANILDAFRLTYASLFLNENMKKVRSMMMPYLKLIVSPNTAEILQNGEIDGYTGKGQTELTAGSSEGLKYKGTPIVPLAGFPNNQILLTYADKDPMLSNLHFGTANQRDVENVKVFNMANGADNLGMRMNFTAGTAVAWPEFCTRYIVPA